MRAGQTATLQLHGSKYLGRIGRFASPPHCTQHLILLKSLGIIIFPERNAARISQCQQLICMQSNNSCNGDTHKEPFLGLQPMGQ